VTKNQTAAFLLLTLAASGCFTTGDGTASPDDGGGSAGDATVAGIDAATDAMQAQPATPAEKAACAANPSGCLTGTAALAKVFTKTPAQMQARLYRVFPFGTEQPLGSQLVDDAGTWTFGPPPDAGEEAGVDPWAHYYVQVEADFYLGPDAGSAVAAVKGPLSVPSSGPSAVVVPPVQLNVLESRVPGGPMQLQWVLAHVFDPTTGAEIKGPATAGGATVSILVGGTSQAIPWSGPDGGVGAYFFQFASAPAAQASYMVSVTSPTQAVGTYPLVAEVPAFDGTVVSPDGGAPVDANAPLPVVWTPEPQADYEVVQIFQSSGFASVYVSPQPDPPDSVQETVQAGVAAGRYLLNVSYSKTNCPLTASGCVQANTVAAANFTAE